MRKQPRPAGDAKTINLANNLPSPAGRGCVIGGSFKIIMTNKEVRQWGEKNNVRFCEVDEIIIYMSEGKSFHEALLEVEKDFVDPVYENRSTEEEAFSYSVGRELGRIPVALP
jgi:hypothetical protein